MQQDFNFTSQNIKVIGVSPLAIDYIDNIQNVGEEFTDFKNNSIYILDHSILNKTENLSFNISGIINDPQPNFNISDLVLSVNTESGNSVNKSDINCNFYNISDNYYTLNCKGEENVKYNLQSAVSSIENDLLIVNFDENDEREIMFNSTNSYNKKYYIKKSDNNKAGIIVAIIVVPILVLTAIITFFIIRKKKG